MSRPDIVQFFTYFVAIFIVRTMEVSMKCLSGGFSLGWAKTGIAILRDPRALHTPKGFWPGATNGLDMGIFSNFGRFSAFLF